MEEENINNNTNFKQVKNNYTKIPKYKEKSKINFGKNVLLPFTTSIIGTTLVIGLCFGVPEIKEKIINYSPQPSTNQNTSSLVSTAVSLSKYSDTAISVANKVLPSIVGIQVEYSVNSFWSMGNSTAKAEGSGIIISEYGYILTNNHIVNTTTNSSYYSVSEASKITVRLYNSEEDIDATIVGTDEQTDLAVIKIDKTNLTPAELGDSTSVQVGEFAMAIGNPLGLQSSVTCGIISAINREITDSSNKTYTVIQTDAAINSGNSGGALVNGEGKVIGINTLKLSGSGIEGMGFAIPINNTKDIYNQLIQYSKVKRPYIGISGIDVDEKTSKTYKLPVGIYVKSVENFSPAQKSDIKSGDVIIEADGKKISTIAELNEIKNTHQIGDTIKLKISRDGSEKEIIVTLSEQP